MWKWAAPWLIAALATASLGICLPLRLDAAPAGPVGAASVPAPHLGDCVDHAQATESAAATSALDISESTSGSTDNGSNTTSAGRQHDPAEQGSVTGSTESIRAAWTWLRILRI
jgi:hypothetical protein